MFCSNCGKEVKPEAKFCDSCGHPIQAIRQESEPAPEPPRPVIVPEPEPQPEPERISVSAPTEEPTVPEENRPLGPWAYFGYGLLFSIPVIGFILLIVFSFAGKNVNRKNFARSYWCWIILAIALVLIVFVLLLLGILRGLTEGVAHWANSIGFTWLAKLIG